MIERSSQSFVDTWIFKSQYRRRQYHSCQKSLLLISGSNDCTSSLELTTAPKLALCPRG